ncbi:hypothetical protein GCM10027615_76790 [Plantactinospora veratri]
MNSTPAAGSTRAGAGSTSVSRGGVSAGVRMDRDWKVAGRTADLSGGAAGDFRANLMKRTYEMAACQGLVTLWYESVPRTG